MMPREAISRQGCAGVLGLDASGRHYTPSHPCLNLDSGDMQQHTPRCRGGNNPMPRLPEPECTCTLCNGRRRQACLIACPSSCVPRLVFATSVHHFCHDASNHGDAPTIVVLQIGAGGDRRIRAHEWSGLCRGRRRLNSSNFFIIHRIQGRMRRAYSFTWQSG